MLIILFLFELCVLRRQKNIQNWYKVQACLCKENIINLIIQNNSFNTPCRNTIKLSIQYMQKACLSNSLQTEAFAWPHPKTVPLLFILLVLSDSPKHLHSSILIFDFLISVEWTIYQIWQWSWSPPCELMSTITPAHCVSEKLPRGNLSIKVLFHGWHQIRNS